MLHRIFVPVDAHPAILEAVLDQLAEQDMPADVLAELERADALAAEEEAALELWAERGGYAAGLPRPGRRVVADTEWDDIPY